MADNPSGQAEKFKELARELECDPDEAAFEEQVRRVATVRPRELPNGGASDQSEDESSR